MKIAVLSGKGGTGKTLVAVNMAAAANQSTYIDCDVEEPNGHLFFKPEIRQVEAIAVKIPWVDRERCSGCRSCVDFCNFNALAYAGDQLEIFDDVCHSCGGCVLVCPEKALAEKERVIGQVEIGVSGSVNVLTGVLKPGEASGIPIVNHLLAQTREIRPLTLIDCPPGSACIVMETIAAADYCILVAEPTVFGVHNLALAYQLLQLFHKPHGAVLNKCLGQFNPAAAFCRENKIPILAEIPYDERLGELNSNARIAAREEERYHNLFANLLHSVAREVER